MTALAARAGIVALYLLRDLAVFAATFTATVVVGRVAGWGV